MRRWAFDLELLVDRDGLTGHRLTDGAQQLVGRHDPDLQRVVGVDEPLVYRLVPRELLTRVQRGHHLSTCDRLSPVANFLVRVTTRLLECARGTWGRSSRETRV